MSMASKDRNFTGCWACRYKKRRCDEQKPVCSLCLKHGDECCYDVRLSWLPENMFVAREDGLGAVSGCGGGSGMERRMSKRKFKQVTELKCDNPVSESASFTISARRFKVYDNCIGCVHKTDGGKVVHDAKYVEERLSEFLERLEQSGESENDGMLQVGPFAKFSVSLVRNGGESGGSWSFDEFWGKCQGQGSIVDGNWCLNEPGFFGEFEHKLKNVVSETSFPVKMVGNRFGSDSDYWMHHLETLPRRFQSAIVFLMYAQGLDNSGDAMLEWVSSLQSVTEMDFPVLAEVCRSKCSSRHALMQLRRLMNQYVPTTMANENIYKLLRMEIEQNLLILDLTAIPSPSIDNFDPLVEFQWDNSDNYMKLEVL